MKVKVNTTTVVINNDMTIEATRFVGAKLYMIKDTLREDKFSLFAKKVNNFSKLDDDMFREFSGLQKEVEVV